MRLICQLVYNERGAAALEALIVTPPLMLIGLAGLELTNHISTQKRVSELAQIIADDASRAGDSTALGRMPLRESDINDVLDGANLQGRNIDLENNGRVILSSLEQDADGQQIIRWRRCSGKAAAGSAYANVSNALAGGGRGIEVRGKLVRAPARDAIMVVELYYDYAPIIPFDLAGYNAQRFEAKAVRLVRDNRDLSKIIGNANAKRCTS